MKIKIARARGFTLLEIMIVLAIIGILAALAIFNLVKARESAQLTSIWHNLRVTENAKDQWALENKKGYGDLPTNADLAPYFNRIAYPPSVVVGETYNINAVGTAATAKTPVKLGTYAANSDVSLP